MSLRGKHKGETCIVVCSGPSLEKNVRLVNDGISDYKVIAVNTSMRLLRNPPDYYVWTERDVAVDAWDNSKQWTCENLISYPYSNPSIFTDIEVLGHKYLVNMACENSVPNAARYIWNLLRGSRPYLLEVHDPIETAQLAMMSAYWMGFKRWVIVGMNYCFPKSGGYYAGMATPEGGEDEEDRIFREKHKVATKTKDINGDDVYMTQWQIATARLMAIQLMYYRQAGIEIIQCSEGGVMDKGVSRVMLLEDFIQEDSKN